MLDALPELATFIEPGVLGHAVRPVAGVRRSVDGLFGRRPVLLVLAARQVATIEGVAPVEGLSHLHLGRDPRVEAPAILGSGQFVAPLEVDVRRAIYGEASNAMHDDAEVPIPENGLLRVSGERCGLRGQREAERRKEDSPVRLAGAQKRRIETLVAAVVVFESHGLRTGAAAPSVLRERATT